VLSSIDIPTAGVIRRVIAGIDVTHTYDSDLDINLISPYGVQRELTTGNGSGVANYRRTLFSDSAATAITSGSGPYTGTFRPEQSISDAAGFGNQSAGGRWNLHVWDHGSGDSGTLNQWSIALCVDTSIASVCGNGYVEATETCDDGNTGDGDGCSATCQLELTCSAGSPVILRSAAPSVIVPDSNATGVSMPITVSSVGTVRKAVVVLGAITHRLDGELDVSLVSPASTTLDLTSDNGSGSDYVSTLFDDAAAAGSSPFRGRFRPEAALSGVNGQAAAGVWNLKVADDGSGDTGVLQSWILGLCVE
jgi:cysteine-rich repeat protein